MIEYHYKRGEGWLPKLQESGIVASDSDGREVLVEKRYPEQGEGWMAFPRNGRGSWFNSDGTINMDMVVQHVAKYTWREQLPPARNDANFEFLTITYV